MITLTKLRPYTGDTVASSPNHGARKAQGIEGIVLHATADGGNEAGSLVWLRSPQSRASCHLFVGRDGRAIRLVGDRQRAWHAGGTQWRGTRDVNSVTLGIEIANRNDGEPFTDAQYGRVAAIVAHYCRQGLSLDDVVGHGELPGSRYADPVGWDWARFRDMVRRQLHAVDAEEPGSIVYDRRSAERRAADEATARGAGDVPPPPDPPDPSLEARALEAGERFVERRATPRSSDRPAVAPPAQRGTAPAAPKPVLRSRTIWLNGLTALAAGSVIVSEVLDLALEVGLTLPRELTTWALFGVGVVNILLRLHTSRPIGRSPRAERAPRDVPLRVPGRAPVRGAPAGA